MRELKFRAWDDKNKIWLHDYKTLGGCHIIGETILFGEWFSGVSIRDFNYVAVEEFTGLHDKNGAEIYEGDIVRWWWNHHEKYGPAGVVNMGSCIIGEVTVPAGWIVDDSCPVNEECEVIGNIHENPELLREVE